MELVQNFFALPGQGAAVTATSTTPGTRQVITDGNAQTPISTIDGASQTDGNVIPDFGNLLNLIIGLQQPPQGPQTPQGIESNVAFDNDGAKSTGTSQFSAALLSSAAVTGFQGITAPAFEAPALNIASNNISGLQNPKSSPKISMENSQQIVNSENTSTTQITQPKINVLDNKTSDLVTPTVSNPVSSDNSLSQNTSFLTPPAQQIIAENIFSPQQTTQEISLTGEPVANKVLAAADTQPINTVNNATPATIINPDNSPVAGTLFVQENSKFVQEISRAQLPAHVNAEIVQNEAKPSAVDTGINIIQVEKSISKPSSDIQLESQSRDKMVQPALVISIPAVLAEKPVQQISDPAILVPAKQMANKSTPELSISDPDSVAPTDLDNVASVDKASRNLIMNAPGEKPDSPVLSKPESVSATAQIMPFITPALPALEKSVSHTGTSTEVATLTSQGQEKSSIQAAGEVRPGATINAPANPSTPFLNAPALQQALAEGQTAAQTITRNMDGISAVASDNMVQVTGFENARNEAGNLVHLDKSEPFRSATIPAVHRTETQPQHVSPPIRDIAIHITQHADTGVNRFQMRLDPADLGRVDVRMEISAEGKLSAVIAVERPETLDLLQRDSRALERSLMEAGLKTDSNSLSFSLKGGRQDSQHSDRTGAGSGNADNQMTDDWDEMSAAMDMRFVNRAVNIRI